MRKIGIVEDDQKLSQELKVFLEHNGYEAENLGAEEFTAACILGREFDLLLLDIGLPGTDGLYLCREIRKTSELPIIMLTSKDTQMTELLSMNQGADDFVAKPFHPQILLARIEAILKRVYRETGESKSLKLGDFVLDTARGVISSKGGSAELTKNELRILRILSEHKNMIVSREELMNELWDSDVFVDDNTLTVNMTRLRGKLDAIGVHGRIQTKRGLGYILQCDTKAI